MQQASQNKRLGIRGAIQAAGISVAIVLTSPLALLAKADMVILGRDEWFKSFAQALSLLPGRTGSYLRVGYYIQTLRRCSSRWTMQIYSKFSHPEVVVSSGVYVGMHSTLGRVSLGRNVLIADYVQVLSGRHHHGTSESWNSAERGGNLKSLSIGASTWVGGGAIVMSDVGENCIVGAGAVVTKPVANGTVVVGNPARVIQRDSEEIDKQESLTAGRDS